MEGLGNGMDALGPKRKRMELSADDPSSNQNDRGTTASAGDNSLKPGFGDALAYLMVLKENLDADKYQEFLKIMKDMDTQRVHPVECVKRVKGLLQGHPNLFLGFHDFLPKGWYATDPSTSEKKPDYKDALAFVRKIRSRFLNNDGKYRSFLSILSMYWTDHKSIDEVYQEVMVLFQDHDDLLEEFSYFIPDGLKRMTSRYVSSGAPFRHLDEGKPTNTNDAQGEKILQKERAYKSHVECDLINGLHDLEHSKRRKHLQSSYKDCRDYEPGKMDMEHEKNLNNSLLHRGEEGHQTRLVMEEESFMDMELEIDDVKKETLSENDRSKEGKKLGKDVPSLSKDADVYRNNLFRDKAKCDFGRANSELGLLNCRRCTTSYCLLPKNYPIPPASYMTERNKSVLNDRLVSVTSGSENSTFKFMRRNKYEECLFRCEDDRFELDVLLDVLTSTAKRVEELLEKVHSNKIGPELDVQIEDHFTSQDLRCIEQLYGDNGLDVVDALRANLSAALPVILTRIKQKQEEGSRKQAELEDDWTEAFAKNHPRSLDHRSFYFKQQDKKTLSPEALLAECKQVKEMDDNMLLESVARNGHVTPNMVFEYTDTEIHDVLYKIIEFSCGENCTSKDELNKVMRIWTTFLEPMFGISSQFQGTESTKETKNHDSRSSVSSSGQSHGAPGAKGFATHLKSGHISNPSVIHTDLGKENLKNFEGGQNPKSVMYITHGDPIEINDKAHPYNKISAVCNCEDETEEGELSPEVHFENSFVDCEGSLMDKVEVKDGSEGRQDQVCPGELMCDVEAEAETQVDNVGADNDGDESTQRCFRGIPNASEVFVDVSNSECDGGDNVQESSCEHDDGEEEDTDHGAKSGSEWVEEMSNTDIFEGEGTNLPFSVCHPKLTKPLSEHAPRVSHDEDRESRIFYGNTSFYFLFRLHQILYERILSAKTNSSAVEKQLRSLKNANPPNHYTRFKNALYSFLDHSADKSKFEDDCCAFVGPQSYLLFTLDILISKLMKQLLAIVSNETDNRFLQLYAYEKSRGPGRFNDLVYFQNASVIHDGDIFRFECSLNPTRLSMQFMEHPQKETEATMVSSGSNFSAYLYHDFLTSVPHTKEMNNVFLRRNIHKCSCDEEHSATCKAMGRIQVINGLQCRMLSSCKVLYVLDTEDVLFCKQKKRKVSIGASASCNDGISSLRMYPAGVQRFREVDVMMQSLLANQHRILLYLFWLQINPIGHIILEIVDGWINLADELIEQHSLAHDNEQIFIFDPKPNQVTDSIKDSSTSSISSAPTSTRSSQITKVI